MGISAAQGKRPVIAGLGITEMGKVYGKTTAQFGAQAVQLAAADAGIALSDIDGLMTASGVGGDLHLSLAVDLGLTDLKLLSEVQAFGATAGAMVQYASMAVASGLATTVAVVFADAPLREGVSAGGAYGGGATVPSGWQGLSAVGGIASATTMYALAARRHMDTYGTTSEQFGAIAVAQRQWAELNPLAQMRAPMTLADHQASRYIADPLHLFDCCLVSNGAVAVIVTTEDRGAGMAQPNVHVLGFAQSHPGHYMRASEDFGLVSGAAQSGPRALEMAGVALSEIDVVELYDCYTYTALISLEDYGFCAKGEGGAFAESGALGPQGSLKVNTGGGQLSSYYMWGMTPLSEAIIQARRQGGERQVAKHDLVLVSGNGGVLDHHSTLVLGSEQTA